MTRERSHRRRWKRKRGGAMAELIPQSSPFHIHQNSIKQPRLYLLSLLDSSKSLFYFFEKTMSGRGKCSKGLGKGGAKRHSCRKARVFDSILQFLLGKGQQWPRKGRNQEA
ncbi:hypothetical protein CDL15_Pgr019660 [Punica granatum]|uniref:Uncharacterized protein n=1 Tax=Punica granatum TaxID=22663 RepID=A0A218X6T1_PUNGR|nr:hypothetical protein CDL15_Pgr019660 [Punica granatum]